jgi:hypothetical protein
LPAPRNSGPASNAGLFSLFYLHDDAALLDAVRIAADKIGIELVTLQVWTFNAGA